MRIYQLCCFTLLIIPLLMGCSDPASDDINLDPGDAVLIIENESYAAEAILGTRMFLDTEYEQITLRVGDSIYIDIMNLNFEEGIVIWDGEFSDAEGTRVFAISQVHGGAGYFGPIGGYLLISEKTDSSISGKLEIDLYDYASSCLHCLGNYLTIEGQFVAEVK